jgi:hypothetical protein
VPQRAEGLKLGDAPLAPLNDVPALQLEAVRLPPAHLSWQEHMCSVEREACQSFSCRLAHAVE